MSVSTEGGVCDYERCKCVRVTELLGSQVDRGNISSSIIHVKVKGGLALYSLANISKVEW